MTVNLNSLHGQLRCLSPNTYIPETLCSLCYLRTKSQDLLVNSWANPKCFYHYWLTGASKCPLCMFIKCLLGARHCARSLNQPFENHPCFRDGNTDSEQSAEDVPTTVWWETAAGLQTLPALVFHHSRPGWLTGLHHFSTAFSWHIVGCHTSALSEQPPVSSGWEDEQGATDLYLAPPSLLPDPASEDSESKRP